MAEHEVDKERLKGTVKWFNASKGFGFITPDQGEQELFVHQSTIKAEGFRSLREGERVEFDVEKGQDGRDKAINVTGPDGMPPQGAPTYSRFTPVAPYSFPSAHPGALSGAFYTTHVTHEGSVDARPHGVGYPGYYWYYTPAPRYPGSWSDGLGQPAPPQQQQMLIRPPRGPSRSGHRALSSVSSKSSGLQVVVHNLPWSCTWQQLKEVFNQWEVVRADVILDEYGRSRGFGTVRFSNEDDASSAIDNINGTEIDGRKITVRLDRYA
eukprot:g1817.t1